MTMSKSKGGRQAMGAGFNKLAAMKR